MRVSGSRLGGCGFGTGGGRETVRLDIYNSFSLGWDVAVGKQNGSLGRVQRNPMHEQLHKTCIPIFVKEHQADFTMVHKWMGARVGKNEAEKSGDIIQATYATLQIFDVFIARMWTEHQPAIRTVAGWMKAWHAAMVIDLVTLGSWIKLSHLHAEEFRYGDLDIEWKRGSGHARCSKRHEAEQQKK